MNINIVINNFIIKYKTDFTILIRFHFPITDGSSVLCCGVDQNQKYFYIHFPSCQHRKRTNCVGEAKGPSDTNA